MIIDWKNKPQWADVWFESFEEHTNSGWRRDAGIIWETEIGSFWYKRSEGVDTFKIHYPPNAETVH